MRTRRAASRGGGGRGCRLVGGWPAAVPGSSRCTAIDPGVQEGRRAGRQAAIVGSPGYRRVWWGAGRRAEGREDRYAVAAGVWPHCGQQG